MTNTIRLINLLPVLSSYNEKGHTSNNCPKKKKDKGKKKVTYRNKKGKVNFFDLPSSCDELLTSESDSDNDLNIMYSDEEFCRDPHCIECR